MANHHGTEGTVKVGSNAVAELRSWEISEQGRPTDSSALDDAWDTHSAVTKSWTGRATAFWDETDTNGQGALTVNASATMNFYPEGATSGDVYYAGTATVTEIIRRADRDSMVEVEFGFTGNGALTEETLT